MDEARYQLDDTEYRKETNLGRNCPMFDKGLNCSGGITTQDSPEEIATNRRSQILMFPSSLPVKPIAFTVEGDGGDVHAVTIKGDQLIPLSKCLSA